jgi:hypothetical protein
MEKRSKHSRLPQKKIKDGVVFSLKKKTLLKLLNYAAKQGLL